MGSRRNIAMPFDVEKPERCGCPTVKKTEDTFMRFDTMHERGGPHRHRMTANAALA